MLQRQDSDAVGEAADHLEYLGHVCARPAIDRLLRPRRDDLADLDNDELVEILAEHELTDDSEAGDIIMAARAHWFADEDDAESDAVASDEASADSAAEDGGDAADS